MPIAWHLADMAVGADTCSTQLQTLYSLLYKPGRVLQLTVVRCLVIPSRALKLFSLADSYTQPFNFVFQAP